MVAAPAPSGTAFDLVAVADAAIATNRKLAAYIAECAALADVLIDNGQRELALDVLAHCRAGAVVIERVLDLSAPPDFADDFIAAMVEATERADDTGAPNG